MSLYDFKVKDINHKEVSLSKYKDKVLLIVNVASRCGFTKQYQGLQSLYDKYKDQGFMILGFPCNQFLYQEPGTEEQIKEFCTTKYNVTFDMFEKTKVCGKEISDLYSYLINNKPWTPRAKAVKWNFEKFLIDRNGNIVNRYLSKTEPSEIESDIKALL